MAGRKTSAHSEDWWEMLAPPTAVRCEGHVQDGSRCRREAHPGATVCRQHGGAAPQVRARAAARIGNAADEMVKRLLATLDDPNVEARDKIKIATDLLDRAGLNAVEKHIIGVGEIDPVESLFRSLLNDPSILAPAEPVPYVPSAQALAYNRAADPQALLEDGDVVDAEILEEAAPLRSPDRPKRKGTAPPKHIREALERLI